MLFITKLDELKKNYDEIERAFQEYFKNGFIIDNPLTKEQSLDFFSGFQNLKFHTTSQEFNHFKYPPEFSHDLLEILYNYDFSKEIYDNEDDFLEWKDKNHQNIEFYLKGSGVLPPEPSGTSEDWNTLMDIFHSQYRMRLFNNFAMGYDYFEKLIVMLVNKAKSTHYEKIHEVLKLSEKYPSIPTHISNFKLKLIKSWEFTWNNIISSIEDLYDLIQFIIHIRNIWAHKLYEITPYFPFQISGNSNHLKCKFDLFGLQLISNIPIIIVKSLYLQILNYVQTTFSITDPQKEGKYLFIVSEMEKVCDKIDSKKKLFSLVKPEFDNCQKVGDKTEDIQFFKIIVKKAMELGITLTNQSIIDTFEYPEWW